MCIRDSIKGKHDGIELADMIQNEYDIPIIFITSLQDNLTFSRASRTRPVSFLMKPFNDIQLQRTIELAIQQLAQQAENKVVESGDWENDVLYQDHFFIKARQRLNKVALEDVLYLESDGHYCHIHTKEKKFIVRMAMTKLEKRLPSDVFLQTHRSFLVNIKKVQTVDLEDNVVIVGDKRVLLSKRGKEALLKKLDWI